MIRETHPNHLNQGSPYSQRGAPGKPAGRTARAHRSQRRARGPPARAPGDGVPPDGVGKQGRARPRERRPGLLLAGLQRGGADASESGFRVSAAVRTRGGVADVRREQAPPPAADRASR